MGAGNAFAALTQGWFGGVNQRNAWDDRKDAKERQKKLDDYYAEEFGWKRDQHGAYMDQHGVFMERAADDNRARDLIYSDDQSRRSDASAAIAAADAAMAGQDAGLGLRPSGASTKSPVAVAASEAGGPFSAPPGERAQSQSGLLLPPMGQSGRPYAIEPGAAPGAAVTTPGAPSSATAPVPKVAEDRPGPALGAVAPSRPQPGGHVPNAEAQRRMATVRATDVVTPAEADYPFSPHYRDRDAMRPGGRDAGRNLIQNTPAAEGAAIDPLAADPEHSYGVRLGPDIAEGAKAVGRGARDVAADTGGLLSNSIRKFGEAAITPVNKAIEYATGNPEAIPNPPVGETVQDRALTAVGTGGNAILDALGLGQGSGKDKDAAPAADPQKPATREAAATAADAMTETESGQRVAQVAAGIGVDPKKTHPTEARERVVGTWMDNFMREGMPIVVRGMVQRGDYEGAQRLQEWSSTAAAQAGLRDWARAGMAASIGDFDGFADHLASAYNNGGYFDDGYSIVRDKSDFIRTPDGDVAGAVITFKDEATGREFQRQFDSADDILSAGIGLLAPEKVIEYQMQQQAARTEALQAVARQRAAEAKDLERRVDSVAKTIFDASAKNAMPGDETMSYAEARQQAAEQLGVEPDAPEGQPVYSRIPD